MEIYGDLTIKHVDKNRESTIIEMSQRKTVVKWWYCRHNGILMDVPSGNLLHGYDSYGKLPIKDGEFPQLL